MYEVGELSMMMVSRMSRPIWERSYTLVSYSESRQVQERTDLDIVPLVIVATVPKQPVMDNIVNVQLIQQRITVLETWLAPIYPTQCQRIVKLTFETDAVKTTTSYNSPTRFMN